MKKWFTIAYVLFLSTGIYSQAINNPKVSPVHSATFSNAGLNYVVGKIYVVPTPIVPKTREQKNIPVNNVKIYPNPVTNILNIETLDKSEIKVISISDMSGKVIYSGIVENNAIDASFLKQGTYTLKLNNDSSKTFKIIKK